MKVTTELTVRVTDFDFLGHVNNAAYVQYLECGREEWYRQAGFSYARQAETGKSTAVVNITINYRKEAKLEKLFVHTKPFKKGNKSFTFHQIIRNDQEENILDATVTEVCFDTKERKSISLLDEIAVHFENKE